MGSPLTLAPAWMSRPAVSRTTSFRAAFGLLLAIGAALGACGGNADDSPPATASAPSITQRPGPTATPGPQADPSANLVEAFPQLPPLDRPVGMVEIPGAGRMLAILQDGRVVSFEKSASASVFDIVLDWTPNTSRAGNEEGMLGIALDPQFARNGYLYLYYSAQPGERRTVLSRFKTWGQGEAFKADLASELRILTVAQPFSNHKGGQLAFGPDGMLYLALGDGGSGGDPLGNGQDLTRNLLGGILRLDVRNASSSQPYAIPADNPFTSGPAGARDETWAYGFRNPWRFSFDRQTGTLWAGDVGQGEREEVDIVEKGKNYGWNITEGTLCYKPPSGCDRSGLVAPVVDYETGGGNCSVVGGFVYRGKAVPDLAGWYVFADYCSGQLWALDAEKAVAGRGVEVFDLDQAEGAISSFAEDADGELYVLSFDGRVYRLAP